MTKTTKEYLKQIENMNRYIEQLLSEVEELRALSQSLSGTQFGERIKGGNKNNEATFVNYIIKINDLEAKINQEIDKFVDLKSTIIKAIDELENLEERMVLRARYISGKSWDDIYDQLNRSKSATHRVHASALAHLKIPTKVENKRN